LPGIALAFLVLIISHFIYVFLCFTHYLQKNLNPYAFSRSIFDFRGIFSWLVNAGNAETLGNTGLEGYTKKNKPKIALYIYTERPILPGVGNGWGRTNTVCACVRYTRTHTRTHAHRAACSPSPGKCLENRKRKPNKRKGFRVFGAKIGRKSEMGR